LASEISLAKVSTRRLRALLKVTPEQERRKPFAPKPKGRTFYHFDEMFGLA
jgi:hypothetical protein